MNQLWQNVLFQVIIDAFPLSITKHNAPIMKAAWAWINISPSKDFKEVCELAGYDSEKVHSSLIEKMKMKTDDRREFARVIRRRKDKGNGV